MNAFADMLFSALLGWVRGLTQSLWAFFVSGGSGGFFSWIGDHCIPVTLLICLAGTAVDLIVRLSRKDGLSPAEKGLRRLLLGIPGRMSRSDREKFDRGYEDGVDMQDLNPDGKDHIPLFESNYPEVSASSDELLAELGLMSDILPAQEAEGGAKEPARAGDAGRGENENRRRRVDRYDSHDKKRLFRRVNSLISDDGDNSALDRLPLTVDRKEAFHEPVYPNRRNH